MPSLMWFGMAIPLMAALILLVFYRQKTKWWELLIGFGGTIVAIIICQQVAVSSATKDIEYWGHMAYGILHEEPFSYDAECSKQVPCGKTCTGSGKNRTCSTKYCTKYYHCVKHSSRSCYLVNDRGRTYYISYAKYKELAKRWGMHQHTVKKIVTRDAHYKTVGDKYNRAGHGHEHRVYWPNTWQTGEPMAITHTYENRLQTMASWKAPSEEEVNELGLFQYPWNEAGYEAPTILTQGPRFKKADKYLRYLNGYLNTDRGGYKKVRLWVLVFVGVDKGIAEYQRSLWKGGNKNEFVVMLGMSKDGQLLWNDVMTQSEADILTVETRDYIGLTWAEKKNDHTGMVDDDNMFKFAVWLGDKVKAHYVKPDFKQYDYIEVEPSLTATMVTFIIIIVLNAGIAWFVVANPWEEKMQRKPDRRGYRYR